MTTTSIQSTQGYALGCDAAWKPAKRFAHLNVMGSLVERPETRSRSYQR